jgi:YVTN family beta-propeller protein
MMNHYSLLLTRVFSILPLFVVLTFSGLRAQNAYITNSLSSTVTVFNSATNAFVTTIGVEALPSGVATSSDGKRIYVANSGSGSVSAIDGETNTLLTNIAGVALFPFGVALSPDDGTLYITDYSGHSVRTINTTTLTVGPSILLSPSTNPWGIVASPDGTKVYVVSIGSNKISVISTATNTVINEITVEATPHGITISPDGTRLYVSNTGANKVTVINTSTDAVIQTVLTGTNPRGIAISPDGSKVFVANYDSDNVTVINTATYAATNFSIKTNPLDPMPLNPFGIAVSADGSRVLVANTNKDQVYIASASTFAFLGVVDVASGPIAFGTFAAPLITTFPVELTSFGAVYESGRVLLSWTTASELNNAEFEIQRSADGLAFESIGSTPGSGTTQLPQAYTHADWDPIPDRNYYRLKQIDFDGQFTYSPIVEARVSDPGVPVLTLSPNPARGEVNLNWGISYTHATLSVYDALGRLHIRKEASRAAYTRLDISQLTPGIYSVALTVGQESSVKRLMVQP